MEFNTCGLLRLTNQRNSAFWGISNSARSFWLFGKLGAASGRFFGDLGAVGRHSRGASSPVFNPVDPVVVPVEM